LQKRTKNLHILLEHLKLKNTRNTEPRTQIQGETNEQKIQKVLQRNINSKKRTKRDESQQKNTKNPRKQLIRKNPEEPMAMEEPETYLMTKEQIAKEIEIHYTKNGEQICRYKPRYRLQNKDTTKGRLQEIQKLTKKIQKNKQYRITRKKE